MGNPFGDLLLDVANQAAKAANAAESTLRRVEQVSKDMFELSQRIAKLEEAKEWNGVDRRKVEERLGTGDHTFQRLMKEVETLSRDTAAAGRVAASAMNEVTAMKKALLKREDKQSSRRWEILKMVLQAAIPLIVSGIGTAVSLYFMSKGGSP